MRLVQAALNRSALQGQRPSDTRRAQEDLAVSRQAVRSVKPQRYWRRST